jgi:hypothetical protein
MMLHTHHVLKHSSFHSPWRLLLWRVKCFDILEQCRVLHVCLSSDICAVLKFIECNLQSHWQAYFLLEIYVPSSQICSYFHQFKIQVCYATDWLLVVFRKNMNIRNSFRRNEVFIHPGISLASLKKLDIVRSQFMQGMCSWRLHIIQDEFSYRNKHMCNFCWILGDSHYFKLCTKSETLIVYMAAFQIRVKCNLAVQCKPLWATVDLQISLFLGYLRTLSVHKVCGISGEIIHEVMREEGVVTKSKFDPGICQSYWTLNGGNYTRGIVKFGNVIFFGRFIYVYIIYFRTSLSKLYLSVLNEFPSCLLVCHNKFWLRKCCFRQTLNRWYAIFVLQGVHMHYLSCNMYSGLDILLTTGIVSC